MDDDLKAYLTAMEGRLLKRSNDSEERILNRVDSLECALRDLREGK
jgi:hypothetical protein